MEKDLGILKWSEKRTYLVSPFKKRKKTTEMFIKINGDPELDEEGIVVANMGIWLDKGIIYHLYVNPTWRNKGLGNRLLKKAERILRRHGFSSFGVLVERTNALVVSFYQKRGYRITEDRMIGFNIMRKN